MPAQYSGLARPVARASMAITCGRAALAARRTRVKEKISFCPSTRHPPQPYIRFTVPDCRFPRKEGFMKLHAWFAAALFAVATAAQAQAPIRIGAFLSVTGPAAFLGEPEQKTLELYVERLNAAGGVLGRKLELVAYDSGGDAEKARTFAKRLIEQDRVDVIVGGSTPGATIGGAPLAGTAGPPLLSLAGAVS